MTTPSEMLDKFAMSVRMPLGVVGMITPWNFPMAIPSWKMIPAPIAGNTVVWKPAEDTPLCAFDFVNLLAEVGIPPGVVNVVFGDGRLRSIAACTSTLNLFNNAITALFILFALQNLKLDAAGLGLIFAVGNISAVVGAVFAGPIGRRFGVGRTIIGTAMVSGIAGLPLVLAVPETAIPLLILNGLVQSLTLPIYNINQVSLRQAITPHNLQGRMNATMRFLVWGTMPIGAFIGGIVGGAIGLREALTIFIIGKMLAFLWVLYSPVRNLVKMPEAVE
jgi:MFS family permease